MWSFIWILGEQLENQPDPAPKQQPLKLESWQTPTSPPNPPQSGRRLAVPMNHQPVRMSPLKKLAIWGIIAAVIGGYFGISSLIHTVSDPRKNPEFTWSNAKATCERMIEDRVGSRERQDRSDVYESSIKTYKLSTWVNYNPEPRLYNCRLIWNGSSWTTDLFEWR